MPSGDGEVGFALKAKAHLAGVLPLVRLRAERPHRGAARGVEDTLLEVALVGHLADLAAQGVHLVHELGLGGPAHRRVAGLPGDAVEGEGEEEGARAASRRGERRLASGVARAHDDDVELVALLVKMVGGKALARAVRGDVVGPVGGGDGSDASPPTRARPSTDARGGRKSRARDARAKDAHDERPTPAALANVDMGRETRSESEPRAPAARLDKLNMGGLASNVVSAHAGVHLQQIVKTFVDYEMFFHPRQKQLRGKSATSRRARHCATRARAAMVELRTVALFAWVASLAHLLVVFNRIDDFSPGALALVLTSLAGALPAIWGASVVVFAPGDLRAALDVALGRAKPLASSAPVAAVFTPLGSSRPSPSPSATRESPSVAVSQLGGLSLASSDDDEDDDRRGWLDVITGIRGMAQALHDANDSASSVALNADLTVSLSALVLKTLALVDPTAENPELGSREDARARQLTDPRAVIKDTCTLAEPLFEAETPLVLRNRLPANELRFIPRDVLSCCLFALLHRAGTRILRGECAMTVDKTRDVAMDSTASTLIARSVASGSIFDHPGGAHRLTPGTASSSDSRRSGGVAEPRLEAGASPPRSWAIRVAVEYHTAAVGRSDPKLGATELRFWRRRMRRVGGSLRLEHVPVDVSTRVERVILTVPTAGSDTYFGEVARRAPRRYG